MTESTTHIPSARPRRQRIADTLAMLVREVDCWVATSDPDTGAPQLVPLSFVWDGRTVLLSTGASSPTGRALVATGGLRLAFGATRDVVMVDGDVEVIDAADLSTEEGDRFALRTGFDRQIPSDALPLLPGAADADPGVARGERARREGPHA